MFIVSAKVPPQRQHLAIAPTHVGVLHSAHPAQNTGQTAEFAPSLSQAKPQPGTLFSKGQQPAPMGPGITASIHPRAPTPVSSTVVTNTATPIVTQQDMSSQER